MAEDIRISELEPTTDLTGLYTIGTDKNNLSKKVSLQFLDDAANYANTQGDYAKASTDAIMDSTGLSQYSLFNTATNYMKNAVVRYNGKLYRFTRIHTAGAWLGTDVEETSLRNEILLVNLVNNLADGGVNADKVAADDRLAKYRMITAILSFVSFIMTSSIKQLIWGDWIGKYQRLLILWSGSQNSLNYPKNGKRLRMPTSMWL